MTLFWNIYQYERRWKFLAAFCYSATCLLLKQLNVRELKLLFFVFRWGLVSIRIFIHVGRSSVNRILFYHKLRRFRLVHEAKLFRVVLWALFAGLNVGEGLPLYELLLILHFFFPNVIHYLFRRIFNNLQTNKITNWASF